MNLVTTGSPNLGSGSTSRLTAARRRDIASLLARPLGAVFGAPLAAVLDALRVERAANDMVANPGQILDPAAADQHHRMLLQIMAFARDIAGNLETVGQPHPRNLAQRRVGLFRRGRVDAGAHAAFLRTGLHRRHLVARQLRPARIADQLIDRRPSPTFVRDAPTARREPSRPGGAVSRPLKPMCLLAKAPSHISASPGCV